MKRTYIATSLLGIICLLIVTACSNEEASVPPTNNSKHPVTITAGINKDSRTRLEYTDNETETKISWSVAQEQFSLMYAGAPAGESYLFVKPEGTGGATASFTCDNAPATGLIGKKLYGVYPGKETFRASATGITMNLSQQPGTLDGIDQYHLMVAEIPDYASDGIQQDANFHFEHKIAIMKLTVRNEEFANQNVSNIAIAGMYLIGESTYTLSTGKWSMAMGMNSITATSEVMANASGEATVYLALIPGMVLPMTVTAKLSGQTFSGGVSGGTIVAGNMYDAGTISLNK